MSASRRCSSIVYPQVQSANQALSLEQLALSVLAAGDPDDRSGERIQRFAGTGRSLEGEDGPQKRCSCWMGGSTLERVGIPLLLLIRLTRARASRVLQPGSAEPARARRVDG